MEKIIITDYPGVLKRDTGYEKNRIKVALPEAEVMVVPYYNKEDWFREVRDATALVTAFLPIDAALMDQFTNLKGIVLNASGYDNIDSDAASLHNIAVIPIEEYCTDEVAEHTLSLILALARGLKHYGKDIDEKGLWQYSSLEGLHRVKGRCLGIVGFGRIGKQVGRLANAFGMKILVHSPTGKTKSDVEYPVTFVTKDQLLSESDIITNHMAIGKEHIPFFDEAAFLQMKKKPLFINVGRGAAVDQAALVKALNEGLVSGAGLDVLDTEKPDLAGNPLTNRENVLLTPHSAFYSEEARKALQDKSCDNLIHFLKGEWDQVHKIVNSYIVS